MSKNGDLLERTEEIVSRYREFYQDLLKTKEAEDEEEKEIEEEVSRQLEQIIVAAEHREPRYTTQSEVEEVIKSLKLKKCKDPNGGKK